ncbi:hypothetical protein OG943_21965 [Amycolatopsis sp. NBC_00345]|uniref:hypothetical protein n=1 Tax=Amycolatopsis sp. NBC_00345 TaxID=2975955 RepID=UPI002E269F43
MENSAGRVSETVTAWLAAVADMRDPINSRHFDELGIEDWKSPPAAEVPGRWLELIDFAVSVLEAREVRGMTVGLIASLKLRDTVPASMNWERSWEFITASLHDSEPPSLYVFRSSSLREWELDTEEHRFPLPGESAVDHAFVRYWRDADEIAAGEEYTGAVYLLRALGDGAES